MLVFIKRNRGVLARIVAGVVLTLGVWVLSIIVAPGYAPDNFHVAFPIFLFGGISLYSGLAAALFPHDGVLSRFGWIGSVIIAAFVIFSAIGSDAASDMDANGHGAYGWFLGALCACLALIGAGIGGLVFPSMEAWKNLGSEWRIRSYRY